MTSITFSSFPTYAFNIKLFPDVKFPPTVSEAEKASVKEERRHRIRYEVTFTN